MHRPNANQLTAMREELHGLVDGVIDAYQSAEEIRIEYARGYPTQSMGGSGGDGGWSDPTYAAATAGGQHPSVVAERILRQITGWIQHGRTIVGTQTRLEADTRTLTKQEREKLAERRNTVERCALCNEPNPKMKRIDGLPYCATKCYFRMWRDRQRSAS